MSLTILTILFVYRIQMLNCNDELIRNLEIQEMLKEFREEFLGLIDLGFVEIEGREVP